MNINKHSIIGELVAQDYRAASVFKTYGIDFCCQGNRTLLEACEKKDINSDTVIQDLILGLQIKTSNSIDYSSWPLDLLINYIEKKHHRFVRELIEEILPYLTKICSVHGNGHPELIEINAEFTAAASELTHHMKKEELILFPYVTELVNAKQDKSKAERPAFTTLQNPIQMMMQEHDTEGERFRRIAALSNNYTPPEDACNTFRVTYALLKEFEEDLHLHIHLENNILFPKAILLEQELNQ